MGSLMRKNVEREASEYYFSIPLEITTEEATR